MTQETFISYLSLTALVIAVVLIIAPACLLFAIPMPNLNLPAKRHKVHKVGDVIGHDVIFAMEKLGVKIICSN